MFDVHETPKLFINDSDFRYTHKHMHKTQPNYNIFEINYYFAFIWCESQMASGKSIYLHFESLNRIWLQISESDLNAMLLGTELISI